MKKKKIMISSVVCVFLTMSAFLVMIVFVLSISQKTRTRINLAIASIEAISDGEDWEGKKLEKVKCKCKNGDKGHTLRCRDNGSYESCTQTQQGLGGCYSVSLFPPSGSLLCEGEEVEKYDGE